ncbi:MAG TPA: prolyl oligopeptidase family serine peptidase [Vicinamibacterales bacterium]|nr:prolyl oligopeptidase family serine peptidase [Vicinamibacterales bacterium]
MRTRSAAFALSLVVAAATGLLAQSAAPRSGYLTPPKEIVDILDAPPLPSVAVGPARETIALLPRRSMPSIDEVSQPMLRLAGVRINPLTNGPHLAPSATGITLRSIVSGAERKIAVPAGARIGGVSFSPDGKRLYFTNTRDTRIDLYIADVATGQTRMADAALNGIAGGCEWLDDSSAVLCGFVPPGRGPAPPAPKVPSGPNIQENYGKTGPVRTYQDLLASAHDEDLFEYYATSQLAFVDAATARRTPIGKPGLVSMTSVSPDGQYVIVRRTKRPFSRLLTWNGFPADVEVWNRKGESVRTIADLPMSDTVPIMGVMTGPRSYRWHPLEPATLVWVEALDKGDIRNKVPHRDRIMTIKAPFTGDPAEVAKTEYRYAGASWTDKGTILLSEADRDTRTVRTWLLTSSWSEPRKLWDRKQQDRYGDPGSPVMRPGRGTILQNGDAVYLSGLGASPEGDRPFLDRLNLSTLATERLFRSDNTSFEMVVGLLDDGASKVLTRAETPTQPPNYFVRDLSAGSKQAITEFKDPHPQITAAERMMVTYKRKDGVTLSGTIYLPPGYQKGQRLPMFVWAYPREFVDADAASQITGSPNRFTSVGGASHLLMLTQGYAIFDGPAMPIVGPGETANDTYVEQLVASAEAAIDKAVELGIADRHRIGVGGHSYGAFMTANLLANSDLFAAGVARSGAYNRSLTPFGFQAETRTFWEIPQIYARMSPFFQANKINEPILLIHGEADNNSGTFPIQSERLYMALKGHGATVRYVTLPHESHGYSARESVFHTLAETVNWLDKYVKNAPARKTTDTVAR